MALRDELRKLTEENQYKITEALENNKKLLMAKYQNEIIPILKSVAESGARQTDLPYGNAKATEVSAIINILRDDGFEVYVGKNFMCVSW